MQSANHLAIAKLLYFPATVQNASAIIARVHARLA